MADKAMGYFPFAAKSQSKSKMQKICWPKRKKYKTRGTKKRKYDIVCLCLFLCVLTAKSVKSRGIQSIPFRFAVNYVRQ